MVPSGLYRRLVHPLLLRTSDDRRRRALEASEAFFPYFAMRVRYDTTNAREGLAGSGVELPELRDYFDRLMDYAIAADWGRDEAYKERSSVLT